MLKDMGIVFEEDETSKSLHKELTQGGWATATGQRGRKKQSHITEVDLHNPVE